MAQNADKVYKNAKVYSVALDGTETHAEAVAIKDGKFVYVGDEAGVSEWIGDTTEVIDCNGKSVIPGLGVLAALLLLVSGLRVFLTTDDCQACHKANTEDQKDLL